MKRIFFFATKSDILAVTDAVEKQLSLRYILAYHNLFPEYGGERNTNPLRRFQRSVWRHVSRRLLVKNTSWRIVRLKWNLSLELSLVEAALYMSLEIVQIA